jgi:hypothetical protein
MGQLRSALSAAVRVADALLADLGVLGEATGDTALVVIRL